MTSERVDVAVVGGGIVGLSTALALAEEHAGRIVVFERSGVNAGASGVQPGGVRQQWSTRLNVALAQESLAELKALPDRIPEFAEQLRFTACGYVFAASSSETLAGLTRSVELQNALRVRSQLLTTDQLVDLVPGLDGSRIVGGSACPDDGYFDHAQGVVEAVAAGARRAGAGLEVVDVERLELRSGGWILHMRDGRSVNAGTVVVAAHIDTAALLRPLGVELPLEAEDRFLFFSEPIRERLVEPLFVAVDWHFAAKHLANGRVLASDLTAAGDPEDGVDTWRKSMRHTIEHLLPILSYVEFPVLARGLYDMTPDAQPIVGPVPGLEGLWVATGFNGRGFMLAPAVGRRLARQIVHGREDDLLAELRLERFEHAVAEVEGQVV